MHAATGCRDISDAKRRLRAIADQLPHARQAAARKVASKVAPTWNKAARTFLLARVKRLADEIVAADELARLRPEISARMVPFLGMAVCHSAISGNREFAALREDVRQALAANVLKPNDLPAEVRKSWGIK